MKEQYKDFYNSFFQRYGQIIECCLENDIKNYGLVNYDLYVEAYSSTVDFDIHYLDNENIIKRAILVLCFNLYEKLKEAKAGQLFKLEDIYNEETKTYEKRYEHAGDLNIYHTIENDRIYITLTFIANGKNKK